MVVSEFDMVSLKRGRIGRANLRGHNHAPVIAFGRKSRYHCRQRGTAYVRFAGGSEVNGRLMEILLLWTGRIAGIVGLALAAWAGYLRLTGAFYTGGLQVGTILMGGMTGLLVACFCLLLVLTERSRR